jgi:thiamine pyrophosphate-dependent acetolactate synthase large subunit-like protein
MHRAIGRRKNVMGTTGKTMPLVGSLEVLRDVRADRVVVTSMGSAREWPRLSQHPLDFHYVPSTMGGAIPLALGLALACRRREFIVLSGDGSLLMNLGSLITVSASGVKNLTIVLLNNSVYEVTGGQATVAAGDVNANGAAAARVDFASIAGNCGISTVRTFDEMRHWKAEAAISLDRPGPRFIELMVDPVTDGYRLESPGPVVPRLAAFRQMLASGPG